MLQTTLNGYFVQLPENEETLAYLAGTIPLRGGLHLDPSAADPWTCDPDRCRPLLGRNLCCKVQKRCRHLEGERCAVHEDKPFGCALFPLELFRIGAARVVAAANHPLLYDRNWTRFDRDMLACFSGGMGGAEPMLEAQAPVLARVFTRAELELLLAKVRELRGKSGAATEKIP